MHTLIVLKSSCILKFHRRTRRHDSNLSDSSSDSSESSDDTLSSSESAASSDDGHRRKRRKHYHNSPETSKKLTDKSKGKKNLATSSHKKLSKKHSEKRIEKKSTKRKRKTEKIKKSKKDKSDVTKNSTLPHDISQEEIFGPALPSGSTITPEIPPKETKKTKPVIPSKTLKLAVYLIVLIFKLHVSSYGPMTHKDFEKQQSVIRRVIDPDTGRSRYCLC